jgi:molybdopterin synthase catalytic subunit
MLHTKIVDSKDKKLSINDAERFISSVEFGASIFFTGTVRNQNNNKSVIGITYDSHDDLVIKSFEEIYKDADEKLNIQDKAVFRDQAYVLSRYIIEEIKKRSPIWKKEHYTDNQSDWLKGNPIVHEKI